MRSLPASASRKSWPEFEKSHDDYNSIMLKALADRLAEALPSCCTKECDASSGAAKDEGLDNEALIAEKYRGIRPAPGIPACPDHTEKRAVELLKPNARALR